MTKLVTLLMMTVFLAVGLSACGKKGKPVYQKQSSGYTSPVIIG